MSKKEQQGFLTIAQNNSTTDYLRAAYAQALSVKISMPDSKYAVIVDDYTFDQIKDKHQQVFDYVIKLPVDDAVNHEWKLSNEWKVFGLTPFKETVKLESDILFTRSINHWWNTFRLKNIVMSYGCKDYLGQKSAARQYRRVFDDNQLPDVYTGLMYFRYSREAYDFFNIVRECWQNWDDITPYLKNYRDSQPTTDLVYAVAAALVGAEVCTLPTCDFINFAHMKNAINGWPESTPWTSLVFSEVDAPMIRVNGINQYYPFHYQDKNWLSDEIIENLEEKWISQN